MHPYFLEPDAALRSVYLIGYDEPADAMRTYKVERIRSATLTQDRYEIPDDFDPDRWLANSWGIWSSDSTPPERVRLRFDASVAHRVREAVWHRSQELTELAGGGVELTVTVAGIIEIRPWILSWGEAVEVLEPPALREAVARGGARTRPRAMPTEVEAKFRAEVRRTADELAAASASRARASSEPPRTVDEVDRYLDTDDGRLAAARWACRLRSREGATRISLKGPPHRTRSPAGSTGARRSRDRRPTTIEPDDLAGEPGARAAHPAGATGDALVGAPAPLPAPAPSAR